MRLLTALSIGLLFVAGISLSGMINPDEVLNFFDVAGTWDPSLAFVMAGALAVAIPGYRIVLRRRSPVFGGGFQLPDTKRIDLALIGGSATFGIGWGIAGFCPGAALPAIGLLLPNVALFVAAVAVGLLFSRAVKNSSTIRN